MCLCGGYVKAAVSPGLGRTVRLADSSQLTKQGESSKNSCTALLETYITHTRRTRGHFPLHFFFFFHMPRACEKRRENLDLIIIIIITPVCVCVCV